jgi:hypothetical protein
MAPAATKAAKRSPSMVLDPLFLQEISPYRLRYVEGRAGGDLHLHTVIAGP